MYRAFLFSGFLLLLSFKEVFEYIKLDTSWSFTFFLSLSLSLYLRINQELVWFQNGPNNKITYDQVKGATF